MSNNYYEIYDDLEPKITGIREGVSQGKIDDSIFESKLWLDEFLYGENSGLRRGNFPEQDFRLDKIWLDKRAKLNDFVSVGAWRTGFIVSNQVVEILQSFHLPPHKFYPITFGVPL